MIGILRHHGDVDTTGTVLCRSPIDREKERRSMKTSTRVRVGLFFAALTAGALAGPVSAVHADGIDDVSDDTQTSTDGGDHTGEQLGYLVVRR